jgi:hypothetical protein
MSNTRRSFLQSLLAGAGVLGFYRPAPAAKLVQDEYCGPKDDEPDDEWEETSSSSSTVSSASIASFGWR